MASDTPSWAAEQIADYAWLWKTQRSWKLMVGNPFCISEYTIPIKRTSKEEIVSRVIKSQKIEKKRFSKKFPDVKWQNATIPISYQPL